MRMPPFPTRAAPVTLGAMTRPAATIALVLAGALACGVRAETGVLPVRPPLPLPTLR